MPPTNQYEIPDHRQPAAHILGWCLEAQSEGEAWLKAQRPATSWDTALSSLSSPTSGASLDGLSNLGYDKTTRIARELVASLANFRHEGEFKPAWDRKLYDTANTLTNLDKNWYRTTHANEAHRHALQYGIGTGTAYFYQTWDKYFHSPYRGDIRLQALNPADVTFIQLPKTHDIQRAYAVIIREELPINLARAIYGEMNPSFAVQLTPDRDSPGWLQKGLQKLQQFVSPALRVAGRSPGQNANASFPTVDIFHMYTLDRSINTSGAPITMGAKLTNWSYVVPSVGDPVPTKSVNPTTGQFFTVPATDAEARIFPLRRYTIFSRTALCYDGSSPYWHGAAPVARLTFCDWAWEALGTSSITPLKTMQDGIVALMRGIEDSAAARLDPPALIDDQMADTWGQAFNPRKAGVRAKAPLQQIADPIKYPFPPEYYNVPPWITEWIEAQEGRMDYQSGVTDLVAIAKAKQVPGADTLEKLLEMAGPIVQDTIRRLELPLQQLGEWRKSMYFQFYTRPRMLTITGPEGVSLDTQYIPEQLAPLVAGEPPEAEARRKRGYLDDYAYHITESGINEIHRMTTKLLYLQLQKAGFPISPWTIADVCQIPNFGPKPEGTNNEMERWVAWQHMQAELQVEIAAEQQQKALQEGLMGGDGAGGAGGPDGAGGPPPSGGAQQGRPPSFTAAPQMKTKSDGEGGQRSTVTTSR